MPASRPPALCDATAAHRWADLQRQTWWRDFEGAGRRASHAPRAAALCLIERVIWSLGAGSEIPGLDSYRFAPDAAGGRAGGTLADFVSPGPTARTAEWLKSRLAKLRLTGAQASSLIDDARRRLPFSLLHGAAVSDTLAGVAARLLPGGERDELLRETLLGCWDASAGARRGPRGTWLRAGELDSPLAPGKLEEVRSREPTAARRLIETELSEGGCMVIASGDESEHLKTLLPSLVEQYRGGGRFPLLVHGAALRWGKRLELSLRDYVRWLTGGAAIAPGTSPVTLLLSRLDLARAAGEPVDGLEMRRALGEWRRRRPQDLLVVIVPRTCLLARHPLPGTIIFRPETPPSPRPATARAPWRPLPLRGREGAPELLEEFIEGVRAQGRRPTPELARVCSALFGGADGGAVGQDPALLKALAAGPPNGRAVLEQLLRDFVLRRWQSRRDVRTPLGAQGPPADPAPDADAQVGASLYCLLSALTPEGERATFKGIDLGRWLCFLRAHSYELAARVLDCMERECLTGVNLVHAPPLEHANLKGARLEGADLYHLNLAEADLRGAKLTRADLSRAHLKSADLRGADLRGADLSYSCLEQADLSGARLQGANLHRANTDGAVGLWPGREP